MWLRNWVTGIAAAGLLAATPGPAHAGRAEIRSAVAHELNVAQARLALAELAAQIEVERETLQYSSKVLWWEATESLRRLDSYRGLEEEHGQRSRKAARNLYKLARGGTARLFFEPVSDRAHGRESTVGERLVLARTMADVAKHELGELAVGRRAAARSTLELVTATRELQALAAVGLVDDIQQSALSAIAAPVQVADAEATKARRRALRSASPGWKARIWLDRLGKVRRATDSGGRDVFGGRVHRPVRGKVVGRFGRYTDRVLQLLATRRGVELGAKVGEPARAVAAGEVVFAGALPGFESVVIVAHGDNYLSLVGRLHHIRVGNGDKVEAGTVLGRVAPKTVDDGLGSTAYLEIRHGSRPVDPEHYL